MHLVSSPALHISPDQSAYLLIWVRQLVQTVREGNRGSISHSSQGQSQNSPVSGKRGRKKIIKKSNRQRLSNTKKNLDSLHETFYL